MKAEASTAKNRNHRRRVWLWILLASLSIVGAVYLNLFFHAYGSATEGTSQAVYELVTRVIPELRKENIHIQFGSRATGCKLYALEHCAVLHVSDEILVHLDYLIRLQQVLEHPCTYAISPHEPAARREALLSSKPNDRWLESYLRKGEPAWHRFGCDRQEPSGVLPWVGPTKVVFNIYRIPLEQRRSEIGDLALVGKLVTQFTLYLGN